MTASKSRLSLRPFSLAAVAAVALPLAAAILWGDPRTALLARNTLLLISVVTGCAVPLGTALAWLLFRTDLPFRRTMAALLGGLLFVPLYVHAAAWLAGFGPSGWLHAVLGGPVLVHGWTGAVIIHVAAAIPWATWIVGIGMRLTPPELEEAAQLEAGPWRVLWHATLPGARGAIGVAALWVTIGTAGEMTVTDLLRVRTLAEEIYTEFAVEPGEVPLRLLPLVAVTAALVVAGMSLVAALARFHPPATLRQAAVVRLEAGRKLCLAVALTLVGLVALIPVGSLIQAAGETFERNEAGQVVRRWTAHMLITRVVAIPTRRRYFGEFRWSLLLATAAATAAIVLAVPLAWAARDGGVRAFPVWTAAALLLAAPGPLVGLAIVRILNQPRWPLVLSLYESLWFAPVAALTLRALPMATLIAWQGLRGVSRQSLEAAEIDGAGPVVRLWRIALPQRVAALACGWLAAWSVALADLSASVLVLPPGVDTLARQVFGLLHDGRKQDVAGICLVLLAIVAAGTAIGWRLLRRWAGERT